VTIELKGGGHFVDQPRDVVTADDGEWVQFRDHDRMLVDDIAFCAPSPAKDGRQT